jgi:hypothetical protein
MPAFHRFDPTPCGFPARRVPVLPEMHVHSLTRGANELKKGAQWYRRGRYALAQAYRLAGLVRGTVLLAPAYHCRTMLDAAVGIGADVLLYPVTADLAPDLAALQMLLNRAGAPVRALLVPHYFGFQQKLDEVIALCDRHGVLLVEDCSHMLVGARQVGVDVPLGGTSGHFAVASPYKFFPAPDGGLLWSNASALPARRMRSPSLGEEARALAQAVTQAVRRRQVPDVRQLDAEIELAKARAHAPPRVWIEEVTTPSNLYDLAEEETRSLAASRWIARHTDLRRLATLRRRHYKHWLRATQDLPGCRPLFSSLPDDCVPYMFPLLIERPYADFFTLKRLGVPVWRWDETAVSGCANASSYRLRLLHLPCHQELSADDMLWMTAAVAAVCRQLPDRSTDAQ